MHFHKLHKLHKHGNLRRQLISWIGGSLNLRDHMNRPDYFALFAWNLCTWLFSTAQ